jgi:hypothetical protein
VRPRIALLIAIAFAVIASVPSPASAAGNVEAVWTSLIPQQQNAGLVGMAPVGDDTFVLLRFFDSGEEVFGCRLERLDGNGHLLWTRDVVVEAVDAHCGTIATDASGLYLTFTTWGDVGGGPLRNQITVRKLTLDGDLVWTRTEPSERWEFATSLAVAEGAVYVSGTSVIPPLRVDSPHDGLVRSYDTDGNLRWTRLVPAADGVVWVGPLRADEQGVFAAVLEERSGTAAIRRYTADGSLAWRHPFPVSGGSTSIASIDRVGRRLLVTGSTTGSLDGEPSLGYFDAFVAGLDRSSGALLWADRWGANEADFAIDGAVGPEGIAVVGSTTVVHEGSSGRSDRDAFVRSYSVDGRLRWARQFGTREDDGAQFVRVDPEGLVVVGTTEGMLAHQDPGPGATFVRRYEPA